MSSPLATQQTSVSTQLSVWYGSLPLATRFVFTLCVGIYALCLLAGWDNYVNVCMSPYFLLRRYEIYRGLTAVFMHGGLLHIVFNMLAFVPLGSALERNLGTVQYAHTIILFIVLASFTHVCLGGIVSTVYHAEFFRCSIGFSGIIFGLIVVDTASSNVQERSIFGFFTVPAKWYPWALLVLFQILMPAVSFMGHLSGLLIGIAYVNGYLDWVLLDARTATNVESTAWMARAVQHPGFITGTSGAFGGAPARRLDGNGSILPWARPVEAESNLPSHSSITRMGRWAFSGWSSRQESGSSFAGQGRTLGGSGAGPHWATDSYTLGPGVSGARGGGAVPVVQPGPTMAALPSKKGAEAKAVPSAPPMHRASITLGASSASMSAVALGAETSAAATAINSSNGASSSRCQMTPADREGVPISEENIKQLEDMGFEGGVARRALEAAGDDLSMAVEILT